MHSQMEVVPRATVHQAVAALVVARGVALVAVREADRVVAQAADQAADREAALVVAR